mmetsp:Transcript_18894/g.47085  ORF Transcript_18894/g.47085 Transcript_18894/m.47085 type:complete len:108 (+) Transcript_18894:156-479(+)
MTRAHVAAHPGEHVVYFEGDMIIRPGAGRMIRRVLETHDFDVAYTYQPPFIQAYFDAECGAACGSLNSGFILWKNARAATDRWNGAVLTALYAMNGGGAGAGAVVRA